MKSILQRKFGTDQKHLENAHKGRMIAVHKDGTVEYILKYRYAGGYAYAALGTSKYGVDFHACVLDSGRLFFQYARDDEREIIREMNKALESKDFNKVSQILYNNQ